MRFREQQRDGCGRSRWRGAEGKHEAVLASAGVAVAVSGAPGDVGASSGDAGRRSAWFLNFCCLASGQRRGHEESGLW